MSRAFFLFLFLSAFSLRAQFIPSDDEKAKWDLPEYQEVIAYAQEFLQRIDRKDYAKAADMMITPLLGWEDSEADLKELRIKSFKEFAERQAYYGEITKKAVISVRRARGTMDQSREKYYNLQILYYSEAKPFGMPNYITVLNKDGEFFIVQFKEQT